MKYRKKPVVIEAVQLIEGCGDEMAKFAPNHIMDWGYTTKDVLWATIKTLEGTMKAEHGDYVIKGIKGEFYPCKPDIFKMIYEPVIDSVASEGLGVEERMYAFEEWCRFAVRRMTMWSKEDDEKSIEFRKGVEQACSDMCVYFRCRTSDQSPPYLERQAIGYAMDKCGMKWEDNRVRLDFYEHFESYIKSKIKELVHEAQTKYKKGEM